jgi:O-antigen ligase
MSALVEQGIPGIVIFVALLYWLARNILSLKRALKAAIGEVDAKRIAYGAAAASSLVVVFVAGLFTDYMKAEVQIWMLAVLALTKASQVAGVVASAGQDAKVDAATLVAAPRPRTAEILRR